MTQKELVTNINTRASGVDTGCSDEKIDQETEGWDDFRARATEEDTFKAEPWAGRTLAFDESRGYNKFEAEKQTKVKRRQEKYEVGRTKPMADHGN